MRRALPVLLLSLAALLLSAAAASARRAPEQKAQPTGRYLVSFESKGVARSAGRLSRVLDRTGVDRAGAGVPELGIATVNGPAGAIAALKRDPSVRSVSKEYRRAFRHVPNDHTLHAQEPGAPGGTTLQWWLGREGFFSAWDITRGHGAKVGVIDSGLDQGHPDLAGRVDYFAEIGSNQGANDSEGHGTHVSGLACALGDNGRGAVGAGFACRLVHIKTPSPLRDEDIVDGIRLATNKGAHAINMSFGGGPPNAALDLAIDYAFRRNVVLVASASNFENFDQGAPASMLQPGDGPNINAGRGLSVTAAEFSDRNAATGRGPQISLAAYGFFDGTNPGPNAPLGLLSTWPGNQTTSEGIFGCNCRATVGGDNRFARIEGTSMAAPQVAALAAMIRNLNPALNASAVMRIMKFTARGRGNWEPLLGFGIIDARRALDLARRADGFAPDSRATARRRTRVLSGKRRRALRVRFRRKDSARRSGLIASGLRSTDLFMRRGNGSYRRVRGGTRRSSALLKLRPGVYRFYTRVADNAGNVEAKPTKADVRVRVLRRR